ncbi:MAG: FAD binding domain-containing protein [Acidobacteria bacterium]|nr:FAD binding domain-containing protein [Acidobacteriota bacterium]MBV9477164.1 FAD binding domain-containing protein [Acidobacteriota bacterium]
MRDYVILHVNGEPVRVTGDGIFESLSRFLRVRRGAAGTKVVCEEGDCGACTVLIGRRDGDRLRYRAVNSCIQFVFQLDLAHVVTVEGLGAGALTPVQDAMVRCHGAQCGYCTPGFVMAIAGMCEEEETDAARGITGNLCRCTGYEPIVKAANESFATQKRMDAVYPSAPILERIAEHERTPVRIANFFKPKTLADAIAFKSEQPRCVIVQGGTDFGVWCNKRNFVPPAVLSLDGVEGLSDISVDGRELVVGARVPLAEFERAVRDLVPELREIMDRFGSPQIKNAGTLAGNIANASPIADTLPFLYVTGATLELTGLAGIRRVAVADFYKGYKTLDLRADEIITRVRIPLPSDGDTLRLYKVSKRSHLDISSFTAAMLMRRTDGRIDSMRVAYGGVGPVVLRLGKTEEFLKGKAISAETFAEAGEIARGEIAPISDVRGAREFRLQLAENALCRFYYDACL